MNRKRYCGKGVEVDYTHGCITITQGKRVVARFTVDNDPDKVREIFIEVMKIVNKWYLFGCLLRRRLKMVRYQPIY